MSGKQMRLQVPPKLIIIIIITFKPTAVTQYSTDTIEHKASIYNET